MPLYDQSVQHTEEQAVAKHVLGALSLIRYRGPSRHMYGMEHLCFIELRPYWVLPGLDKET